MVTAGETTGKQTTVFARLARRAEFTSGLMRKFYGAMVMPGITMLFLFAALLIFHFKILPSMMGNFTSIRATSGHLPVPTEIAVAVSEFVNHNPIIWAVVVLGGIATFMNWNRITTSRLWQKMMVRIPVVGETYRMMILARSLDALALLNEAGVDLKTCFELSAEVAGQFEYREFFLAVYKQIAAGKKPYTAFLIERHRIGPEGLDVATRIEAASVTGELADSLKKTAATMQSIADSRLEALPKLLGPISTVIASVVVGVLAMAIMLPSFQMLIDSLKGGAPGAKH